MRTDGRAADEMRKVKATLGFSKFAEGSCLIEIGDTMVLCNASVEERVPPHVTSGGWVTAEYSMLPRANRERSKRDISKLKLSGRSAEIQRLIGRSLRSAIDLEALGQRTVTIDCDVLQGDGGTRTASITGAWVALHDALMSFVEQGKIKRLPLTGQVAAISAGIVGGVPLLDLDYPEDSHADVDLNLVGTADGGIVEIQGTGERSTLSRAQLNDLLDMAEPAIARLCALQDEVTGFSA